MSKSRHNRVAFRSRREPHDGRAAVAPTPGEALCERCLKPKTFCICPEIAALDTRTRVLILQHPQEPKELLGTARIAALSLPRARLKVGLSWRNLAAALGEEVNHQNWGVLFLGTVKSSQPHIETGAAAPVTILSSKGKALQPPLADQKLEGVVALDGNWRQAKALWWRNPWLLKLKRIVLNPGARSLYGPDRKEPRAESLSTLEALALCLSFLEERPELEEQLLRPFRSLLEKYRLAKNKA